MNKLLRSLGINGHLKGNLIKGILIATVIVCLMVMVGNIGVYRVEASSGAIVNFPDPGLQAAIRSAIGKPTGDIYESDLANLTSFTAQNDGISNLEGLEYCTSLTFLDLDSNNISDISAISSLPNLQIVRLFSNNISNLSPLSNMTNLQGIGVGNNPLSDISTLSNLINLTWLDVSFCHLDSISVLSHLTKLQNLQIQGYPLPDTNLSDKALLSQLTTLTAINLYGCQVHDISFLSSLRNLTWLDLEANQIQNITTLSALTKIQDLRLINNQISNISPLVANQGLGTGVYIYLSYNYLNLNPGSQNIADINTLIRRGANVSYQPQNAGPIPTTTTVTSSVNPSVSGQQVTLTASVSPIPDGGTVQFEDNSNALGSPVTINSSGQATFITSNLSIGNHIITAVYGGDTNFVGSNSFQISQVVNQGITFTGSGLPPSVEWGVLVNNQYEPATGNTLSLQLNDGTYDYYLLFPSGWDCSPVSGEITLSGSGAPPQMATFTPYSIGAIFSDFNLSLDQWAQQNIWVPGGGLCYDISTIELSWYYFDRLSSSLPRLQTIYNNLNDSNPSSIGSVDAQVSNSLWIQKMAAKIALMCLDLPVIGQLDQLYVCQEMESEIQAGRPVMVLMAGQANGDWLPSEGHAVVAYGYKETSNQVEFYCADCNYPSFVVPLIYNKSSFSFTYYWNWGGFIVGDIPLHEVVSQSGTVVSQALGVNSTQTTIQNTEASAIDDGVGINITGATEAPDGTSVTISATYFGGVQASGTGSIDLTGAQYYDVDVSSSSDLGSNAIAEVSIINPDMTPQTIIQYWNGSRWENASNISISGTTITGDIPVSDLGGTPIAIGVPMAAPAVTSISPSSGPTTGGISVTISGTGFVNGATVTIGSVAATDVTFVSSTSITAITPAGTAGAQNVVVTNPDSQFGTLTGGFIGTPIAIGVPMAAPAVTSISPSSGPTTGGISVTISGTGFVNGATVTIGSVAATDVTFVSSTSITAITPAGTAGAQNVVVTNPDSQFGTLTGGFIYGARIKGTTYEANGAILGEVTLTVDATTQVTSATNGTYQLIVATTGSHTIVATETGYRSQTQTVNVTDLTVTYPLNFLGDNGLVPNTPDVSFVLACINKWKYPPTDGTALDISKVLSVINAWKFPSN